MKEIMQRFRQPLCLRRAYYAGVGLLYGVALPPLIRLIQSLL